MNDEIFNRETPRILERDYELRITCIPRLRFAGGYGRQFTLLAMMEPGEGHDDGKT